MATNLRLSADLQSALKDRSQSTGRSQQDLMREAIRKYLEDDILRGLPPRHGFAIQPAREPYRKISPRLSLPAGVTSSLELMDREDRFS
jgi:hypothetical protein